MCLIHPSNVNKYFDIHHLMEILGRILHDPIRMLQSFWQGPTQCRILSGSCTDPSRILPRSYNVPNQIQLELLRILQSLTRPVGFCQYPWKCLAGPYSIFYLQIFWRILQNSDRDHVGSYQDPTKLLEGFSKPNTRNFHLLISY